MPAVQISTHPLVARHLVSLRDPAARPAAFRQAVRQLTQLLAYEATRDIPTRPVAAPTPLGVAEGREIALRVAIVPILRAGLGMADGLLELIPDAAVWHVGLFRDEATLEPREYYNRLPPRLAADAAFVVDPMLATGGSAVHACRILAAAGIPRIALIALIAAPEGIARLTAEVPGVSVYAAACDAGLDASGFIVPGLGDAGDRQFNTLPPEGRSA